MTARKKREPQAPAEGELPPERFDEVVRALMKVPPRHRTPKPAPKKKPA